MQDVGIHARAKAKIRDAGIPYRVPTDTELPERVRAVLAVVYLIFNEGYAASAGEELVRVALCAEAVRLARLVAELMPDEPEAVGLLALMLLIQAWRETRATPAGDLVLLKDQDRSCWDRHMIHEGQALVRSELLTDVADRRDHVLVTRPRLALDRRCRGSAGAT